MGVFNIFGFFVAAVSFSALAADPPVPRGNVSATLNPTTGYYSSTNSTFRLPNGVSISPAPATPPVVSKYAGGLQQTIPTGITIDAIKKSAPLPASVRAKTPSLKTAAKGLFRGSVAGLVLGAGLQQLLDGIGALIEDGGVVQRKPKIYDGELPDALSSPAINKRDNEPAGMCRDSACILVDHMVIGGSTGYNVYCATNHHVWATRDAVFIGYTPENYGRCYYSQTASPDEGFTKTPMPLSELDDAIDTSYNPEPTDWENLTPHLELDDVEITSAPTLQSNPKTTTIYDADGNPVKVQETNIWHDFDIRDNPSPSPSLDMKTREETKTYEDGVLTGTTTTESTATGGAGGGGGDSPPSEVPTDCDFMPTVCAFIDWFQDDDTPEEPDLSALIDDRDFEESYNISGGSKQCPPDYEFIVELVGRTYGLSFEPACDFASKMYYFTMAAAYIFAAYITVGAVRRG